MTVSRFDWCLITVAIAARTSARSLRADARGGGPAGAKSSSDRDGVEPLGLPETGRQGTVDREWFESLTNKGKLLLLAGWREQAVAERWQLPQVADGELQHRWVRIIRDYGMFDRAEAPQYYPPAARTG